MEKLILLDTSVLIEHFRKKDKSKTTLYKLSEKGCRFSISAVTYYEIFIGQKKEDALFWKNLMNVFIVEPFELECSRKAVEIFQLLRKNNKIIETPDLFIAATALSKGIPIATLNKKHFERIEGLEVI